MTPPDILRPRTGRETSRNNANQREPTINQNGRPETVSRRLRRSAVWGASIWGTEGREFKSPQPDNKNRSLGGQERECREWAEREGLTRLDKVFTEAVDALA